MKKIILFILLFFLSSNNIRAEDLTINSKSSIMIESSTNTIIYEKEADTKRAPASMTKLMTLLLTMEAIDNNKITLEDEVNISEKAASMGGSQIFLQPNSKMKVKELIKGVAIASGNDAAVALLEKISGTTENFIELMNKRAIELGCKNTTFKNVHGLDEEGHLSTARDMAIIAQELIKHESILEYTSIYEEYLNKPDGSQVWLVNTNKLIRYYEGVDGLKTGYTTNAGYCLTSTAKRNNIRFITVVMGVDTSSNRSLDTTNLLNYGFNNYKLNTIITTKDEIGTIYIERGKEYKSIVIPKDDVTKVLNINEEEKEYTYEIELNKINAPINHGDVVGKLKILNDNKEYKTIDLTVKENIKKATIIDIIKRNIKTMLTSKSN